MREGEREREKEGYRQWKRENDRKRQTYREYVNEREKKWVLIMRKSE